jgi:cell division protein FtsB
MMKKRIEEGEKRSAGKKTLVSLAMALLTILLICVIGYNFTLAYNEKQGELQRKQDEIRQYERQIEKLRRENEQLRRDAEALRTEEGVEKVAREKLGLVKPNEVPFVVVENAKDESATVVEKKKEAHRAPGNPIVEFLKSLFTWR